MCGSKKSRYNKIKTPLNKIPLVGNILFWMILYKMNEIVSKFLLAGDIFMPEKHLKQPGFTYSACGPFTWNKEGLKNLKKQEILDIYENELDKACFQHDLTYELDQAYFQYDMAYGDFKDLPKRTPSVRVLRDKTFNTVKIPKYDAYQGGVATMIYKFPNTKTVSLADNLL